MKDRGLNKNADSDITKLLAGWGAGSHEALDQLVPIVYQELRRVAHLVLAGERRDVDLHTSVLVNEAFLKLNNVHRVEWQDRTHFFRFAARLMRRILVDLARRRNSDKRGGGLPHVVLEEELVVAPSRSEEVLAVDQALESLAALDDRKVRVVEMRFYAGLSVRETAAALEVSPETVQRDWRWTKAWLQREIKEAQGKPFSGPQQ